MDLLFLLFINVLTFRLAQGYDFFSKPITPSLGISSTPAYPTVNASGESAAAASTTLSRAVNITLTAVIVLDNRVAAAQGEAALDKAAADLSRACANDPAQPPQLNPPSTPTLDQPIPPSQSTPPPSTSTSDLTLQPPQTDPPSTPTSSQPLPPSQSTPQSAPTSDRPGKVNLFLHCFPSEVEDDPPMVQFEENPAVELVNEVCDHGITLDPQKKANFTQLGKDNINITARYRTHDDFDDGPPKPDNNNITANYCTYGDSNDGPPKPDVPKMAGKECPYNWKTKNAPFSVEGSYCKEILNNILGCIGSSDAQKHNLLEGGFVNEVSDHGCVNWMIFRQT